MIARLGPSLVRLALILGPLALIPGLLVLGLVLWASPSILPSWSTARPVPQVLIRAGPNDPSPILIGQAGPKQEAPGGASGRDSGPATFSERWIFGTPGEPSGQAPGSAAEEFGLLDAMVLAKRPISALAPVPAAVDPDPVATFLELIAPPSGKHPPATRLTRASAPAPPRADIHVGTPPPGRPRPVVEGDMAVLRKLLDRGVVAYASATNDAERAKGASLIQAAALAGYPLARSLLARNYPQSAAVRAAVPADDAIRYALDFLKDPAAATDDSENLFLALEQHFGREGELDAFAAQILGGLRGNTRPQLSHRIDRLLDLLSKVAGACAAVARQVPGAENLTDAECPDALGGKLRTFIETSTPADIEGAARRRGMLLLNQLDVR